MEMQSSVNAYVCVCVCVQADRCLHSCETREKMCERDRVRERGGKVGCARLVSFWVLAAVWGMLMRATSTNCTLR